MIGGAITAIFGCATPTAPLQAPLDDAIAYVQLADPLSDVARSKLGIPLTPERLRGRERCPYNGAARRFECADHISGALTYRRSYQLLLENGAATDEWGEHVVAIRFVSDAEGTVTTARGTFTVSRHDEATLGDLRELRQTLSGMATLAWSDGSESWSSRRAAQLQVMSRARTSGAFPVGSIDISADRGSPTARRTASIAFDGSSVATMLVSADGSASVSCRIDLSEPDPAIGCP